MIKNAKPTYAPQTIFDPSVSVTGGIPTLHAGSETISETPITLFAYTSKEPVAQAVSNMVENVNSYLAYASSTISV